MSALNLRETKYVSIGRVIANFSTVDKKIVDEIKVRAMKTLFSAQVGIYDRTFNDLERRIEKMHCEKMLLVEQRNKSIKENKALKLRTKQLENTIN